MHAQRRLISARFPSRRRPALMLGALAVLAVVPGCKLIDQRTFDPSASRPPKPYIPPRPPAHVTPPLLEIMAGTAPETWRDPVMRAARVALARKPSVLFTVEAIVPAEGDAVAQRKAMGALTTGDAQSVAAAIMAAGVPASQVQMTAMPDSGVRSARVRVYIR